MVQTDKKEIMRLHDVYKKFAIKIICFTINWKLSKPLHTVKKSFLPLCPTFISFLALLFTGCGSSPSSLSEDAISEMEAIADLLNDVKSQEDFDDIKDDVLEHAENLKEIGKEITALENEMPKEEKEKYLKEYGPKLVSAMGKMMKAASKAAAYGFEISNLKWLLEAFKPPE